MNPTLRIERLDPSVPLPSYAKEGDAGMDLCALMLHDSGRVMQSTEMLPKETKKFGTGVRCEIPYGYELQIRPRSSMSLRGLHVHFGTVDTGYRGQIMVTVTNVGWFDEQINNLDRIAQAVLAPVTRATIVEGVVSTDTERGEAGFGSTGR